MLKLNKEFSDKKTKFIASLRRNLDLENVSKKIDAFYELSFEDFCKELKKKKINLSLNKQDEWEDYFNYYKKELTEIKEQIDKTDNEIDLMVYKLYDLTYNEVKTIDPEFKLTKEDYEKFELEGK